MASCWLPVGYYGSPPQELRKHQAQVARAIFVRTHFPNRNGDVVGAAGLPMLQAFGWKRSDAAIWLQTRMGLRCAHLVCDVFTPGRQPVASNVEALVPCCRIAGLNRFRNKNHHGLGVLLPPFKLEPNCSSHEKITNLEAPSMAAK